MMEQKPDSAGVILGDNFGSEVTTKVKELVVPGGAAGQTLIRHGGVINVLYLDGHISSLKWQDLDVNSLPPPERANFAIRYTL
jgi:prepilin-type processing-associated H-X9-DG protein